MAKATIPLYQDDDFERLADLRRAATIAQRHLDAVLKEVEESPAAPSRAGDDEADPVREAREALKSAQDAFDQFVDEASERAELWSVKPIGHEEFRELLKSHPPRKVKVPGEDGIEVEVEHKDDAEWGVNSETFPKALLLFVDPDDDTIRTIVEPKFDTEAALRKRVKRLSRGEFRSLWVTAYMANEGGLADPKASKFSTATRGSSAT